MRFCSSSQKKKIFLKILSPFGRKILKKHFFLWDTKRIKWDKKIEIFHFEIHFFNKASNFLFFWFIFFKIKKFRIRPFFLISGSNRSIFSLFYLWNFESFQRLFFKHIEKFGSKGFSIFWFYFSIKLSKNEKFEFFLFVTCSLFFPYCEIYWKLQILQIGWKRESEFWNLKLRNWTEIFFQFFCCWKHN